MRRIDKQAPPIALEMKSREKTLRAALVETSDPDRRRKIARDAYEEARRKPPSGPDADGADASPMATALSSEQRDLCVFCERRLEPRDREGRKPVRVAHWDPIGDAKDASADKAGERALDWTNIYASCRSRDTCDQHQGNRSLAPILRPGDPLFVGERWLQFDDGGGVSPSPQLPVDVADCVGRIIGTMDGNAGVLNLNKEQLRANRAEMLSRYQTELSNALQGGQWAGAN